MGKKRHFWIIYCDWILSLSREHRQGQFVEPEIKRTTSTVTWLHFFRMFQTPNSQFCRPWENSEEKEWLKSRREKWPPNTVRHWIIEMRHIRITSWKVYHITVMFGRSTKSPTGKYCRRSASGSHWGDQVRRLAAQIFTLHPTEIPLYKNMLLFSEALIIESFRKVLIGCAPYWSLRLSRVWRLNKFQIDLESSITACSLNEEKTRTTRADWLNSVC